MNALFLILIFPLVGFSQPVKRTDPLLNPESLSDFEHQNKGCPENSECDPVMGSMLTRWKTLIEKLSATPADKAKNPQTIELFRQKYGLPVEFYTYQKSQLGFKPLLFNSPCKEHNPKEGDKTLRGMAFIKSMMKDKAIVIREEATIEVPTSESLIVTQPVMVMENPIPDTYYLPIGDQPLFIKGKELYVVREAEDLFYALKVSLNGDWKVVAIDLANLSQWEEKREPVACPVVTLDKKSPQPKEFAAEFCKTVWNEDLKKTVIVKMFQGCSI